MAHSGFRPAQPPTTKAGHVSVVWRHGLLLLYLLFGVKSSRRPPHQRTDHRLWLWLIGSGSGSVFTTVVFLQCLQKRGKSTSLVVLSSLIGVVRPQYGQTTRSPSVTNTLPRFSVPCKHFFPSSAHRLKTRHIYKANGKRLPFRSFLLHLGSNTYL